MAENNQANAPAQEQDLSEILKVRREKLAALARRGTRSLPADAL